MASFPAERRYSAAVGTSLYVEPARRNDRPRASSLRPDILLFAVVG